MFIYVCMSKQEYIEKVKGKSEEELEVADLILEEQVDDFLRERYVEHIGDSRQSLLCGLITGKAMIGYETATLDDFRDDDIIQLEIELEECENVITFHYLIYSLRKDKGMSSDYFNNTIFHGTYCKNINQGYMGGIVAPITILANKVKIQRSVKEEC